MAKASEKLEELLSPVVESLGYELWCVELMQRGRESLLRLYIEHADGIGLDDCERVSREVASVLDVEDPISGAYRLEVSSPGLDRPLVKLAHFQRFCGEQAQIQLYAPMSNGQRRFEGQLLGATDNSVQLRTVKGDQSLPWADIAKARLMPNLDIARAG